MTYGNETMPLLVDVGLKFERAEMQMIRWMKKQIWPNLISKMSMIEVNGEGM